MLCMAYRWPSCMIVHIKNHAVLRSNMAFMLCICNNRILSFLWAILACVYTLMACVYPFNLFTSHASVESACVQENL